MGTKAYITTTDRNGNVIALKDISSEEEMKYLEELCESIRSRFGLPVLLRSGISFTITGRRPQPILSHFSFDLPEVIEWCKQQGLDETDVTILKLLNNKMSIKEIAAEGVLGKDAINKRLRNMYNIFLGVGEEKEGEKKLYLKVLLKIKAHFSFK